MNSPTLPTRSLITNPLIEVFQSDELVATGTLERCAVSLEFLSNLIGTNDGHSGFFQEEDSRHALSLHLDGVAAAVRAVVEALSRESDNEGSE